MSNGVSDRALQGLIAARRRVEAGRGQPVGRNKFSLSLAEFELELIDLIGKLEQGIATEADKRRAAIAKNQLEYRKAEISFQSAMYESQSKNARARLQSATQLVKARETAERRYNEKVRTSDAKILLQLKASLNNKPSGMDSIVQAFNFLQEPVALGSDEKKPKLAPDDPKYVQTLAEFMKELNDYNKKEVFVLDKSTGRLNLSATRNNLVELNIDDTPVLGTIMEFLRFYDAGRQRRNVGEADMARLLQEANQKLNATRQALEKNDENKALLFLEQFDELQEQKGAFFASLNGIKSKSDLDEIIEQSQQRGSSLEKAEALYERLQTGSGAKNNAIAAAVANPNFRAWAADYGWDRLGRVQVGEDGKPDLSSYVAGGDDIAAILAWGRQSTRRAGNYGLRKIRTGEIFRVELRDGTVVTGERLRRHSADPMGSIRIVQPDGARLLTPADVSQAIVLSRPEPDPVRIDARARRIYKKNQDQYASLEISALRAGDFEDRADLVQNQEGLFAVNEAGEYLSRDAVDSIRSNQYNDRGYHFITDPDSGANFVVGPENVFPLDENLNLGAQLSGDEAAAIRQKVPRTADTRMMVQNQDGAFISFSAKDMADAISAGKIPTETQVVGFVDDAEQTTARAALEIEQSEIKDQDLGLKFEPGPGGIDPTTLAGGDGSTGIYIVDLKEPDDFQLPDEDPPETAVQRSSRELIDEVKAMGETDKPFDQLGVQPEGDTPLGRPTGFAGDRQSTLERFAQFTPDQQDKFPELKMQLDAAYTSGKMTPPEDYVFLKDRVEVEQPKPPKPPKTEKPKSSRPPKPPPTTTPSVVAQPPPLAMGDLDVGEVRIDLPTAQPVAPIKPPAPPEFPGGDFEAGAMDMSPAAKILRGLSSKRRKRKPSDDPATDATPPDQSVPGAGGPAELPEDE